MFKNCLFSRKNLSQETDQEEICCLQSCNSQILRYVESKKASKIGRVYLCTFYVNFLNMDLYQESIGHLSSSFQETACTEDKDNKQDVMQEDNSFDSEARVKQGQGSYLLFCRLYSPTTLYMKEEQNTLSLPKKSALKTQTQLTLKRIMLVPGASPSLLPVTCIQGSQLNTIPWKPVKGKHIHI